MVAARDTMREEFEAAARRITHATTFTREGDGYEDYVIDTYWRFWQEANAKLERTVWAAVRSLPQRGVYVPHDDAVVMGPDRSEVLVSRDDLAKALRDACHAGPDEKEHGTPRRRSLWERFITWLDHNPYANETDDERASREW